MMNARWGEPPWEIDFHPTPRQLPEEVDYAVVGGGFTGLSAAAWLRRLEPHKSVAVFESMTIGAGASGRTGGMTLAETAVGDLPGLGDVLGGLSGILSEFVIDCDLALPGAWELGRNDALADSPISWTDSGQLRAVRLVSGGTVDPGKLVSGLARTAERIGTLIFEESGVDRIRFEDPLRLEVGGQIILAKTILLATNAMALDLNGLAGRAQPKFTLAVATEPLSDPQIRALGLDSGRPFYTIDFPYLWGRLLPNNAVVFGCGLVHLNDWRELTDIDIAAGQSAELIARLECRVRGLHPAVREVQFTHRWGGPILIGEQWRPVFTRHPLSPNVVVLGAYSGHGVALSVYLGRWAAEAMTGQRKLPDWDLV